MIINHPTISRNTMNNLIISRIAINRQQYHEQPTTIKKLLEPQTITKQFLEP
jgi:hypothetical protein